MKVYDILSYSLTSLRGYRLRTALMLTAMAISVAAVILLTALGEGARRYVTGQFASLGTHLIIVLPGRSETAGASPALIMGKTPRDLTLQDAVALQRSRNILRIAPINLGSASVSWRQRDREVPVFGSTSELLAIRHWEMTQGRFLPTGDIERPVPVCVLGVKLRNELFGAHRALGEWVRIGEQRFRVIGVLASEGRSIGVDVEELAIIPVASAQALFNASSLYRILVQAKSREAIPHAKEDILNIIKERHHGKEDITVVTQDAVLATFDRILKALTYTVAGIAAISLVVAGILIMNVMLVAVSQRTAEIGLLKALGAKQRQIILLFLTEAAALSLLGALIGLGIGQLVSWIIGQIYPDLPLGAPWWAIVAAIGIALSAGILFGAMPARRAAKLDPVQALARR